MKIGILGGGQLSQMLALAGIPLGIDFSFYFSPDSSYFSTAELGNVFHGNFENLDQLKLFAKSVSIITYENENIPIKTIEYLEKFKPIYPDKHALKISQDRLFEKNLFTELNIPTNQYVEINSKKDLLSAAKKLGYPFILKKEHMAMTAKDKSKLINSLILAI